MHAGQCDVKRLNMQTRQAEGPCFSVRHHLRGIVSGNVDIYMHNFKLDSMSLISLLFSHKYAHNRFYYWFWSQIHRLHSKPPQKQKLGPSLLKVQKLKGKNSSLPKCSNCTILISLCSSYHLISLLYSQRFSNRVGTASSYYLCSPQLRPMAGKGGLINHLMQIFFLFSSQGKKNIHLFFPPKVFIEVIHSLRV